MITAAEVQTIRVAEYFEYDQNISLETLLRGHALLMGDDCGMGMVNKVMPKRDAIELARSLHKERSEEFSELWISTDAVRAKEVQDYFGICIFPSVEAEISGWLVFYDPSTYMNWEHACEYHFIVDDNCIETCSHLRAPEEALRLDKI